jgi:N-methylhydantoinase A
MKYVIGVDIGGTFSDCVVLDAAGRVAMGKAFSTPPDFSRGIMDALAVVAGDLGTSTKDLLSRTELFLHSTTVAENALVNDDLTPACLITTRGHEDALFAMRGGFGRWSGLTEDEKRNPIDTDKPPPIIPRELVLGVPERVDAHGKVLQELKEADIEVALRQLRANGAEAIGACFLWSFANPANEEVVRRVVKRLWPDAFLTLSHEIAPILGEYERASTVALNARLGPVVGRYLDRLRTLLGGSGFSGTLLVMQAHGGLLPFEQARTRPVSMIESGPVSGLVGASNQGRAMGLNNIIATDLGGTTFKVGIVRAGHIEYQREAMVLRYHYALPKMDITSLGIAGGSVIWIDPRTRLPRIGPRSAGSFPGPVCYGHGGTEPTITDVDVLLGYMNPRFFLRGRAQLDRDLCAKVFEEQIARPLGMPLLEAAAAIYRLANSIIYDLLHKTTVQRGLDPRRFALFSYGGTAGMHLPICGDELGVSPVVIPYTASVNGAFGLVTSDIVHEEQVTLPQVYPPARAEVERTIGGLRERVLKQLREEGFANDRIRILYSIDMSYRRQVHVLTVPMSEAEDPASASAIEAAVARFEQLYREKYGPDSGYREAGIELVTFRARGVGELTKPKLRSDPARETDAGHAVVERRDAWVSRNAQMESVLGYDLEKLANGNEVPGPAVIWTPITTVVLGPAQVAQVDEQRNLVITRRAPAQAAAQH